MLPLVNFSIESDTTVFLSFLDGTERRVTKNELPRYLAGRDLEKVRRAFRLRRDFFNKILPSNVVIAVLLASILLLVGYDAAQIATRLKNDATIQSTTAISGSASYGSHDAGPNGLQTSTALPASPPPAAQPTAPTPNIISAASPSAPRQPRHRPGSAVKSKSESDLTGAQATLSAAINQLSDAGFK